MPSLARRVRFSLEAAVLWSILKLFSMMPVERASALAGAIMRFVGPRTKRHRHVLDNLERVLTTVEDSERRRIAAASWENIGRVMAEYPHLPELLDDQERVKIIGLEKCVPLIAENKGGFLLSAHYGNWEISTVAGRRLGLNQVNFYRAVKNPTLDSMLSAYRRVTAPGGLVPKANDNIRTAVRLLKDHRYIGMLVDRRESKGIVVPFMGFDAQTNHAPALLARRFNVPIFLGRVIRHEGVQFVVECLPVAVDHTDDWEDDVRQTTIRINDILSSWIAERPEQWLWLHRRWAV
jgi:KDO2-lipid IV(A) lauroyltransferase